MRWPWRQRRAIEPRPMVSTRAMELQTAKEILAEVFHARPGEVEEMIQRRLGERRAGMKGAVSGDVLPGGVILAKGSLASFVLPMQQFGVV